MIQSGRSFYGSFGWFLNDLTLVAETKLVIGQFFIGPHTSVVERGDSGIITG